MSLIAHCKKGKTSDFPVCTVLNALPSLPTGGTGLPSLSIPTSLLPTILGGGGILGANRPAAFGPRGPTMRQLSRMYDPALVDLLVPGMVIGT
jgi:phospholipid/cholesterol/gamma-HCH transport system substrate-binding protein